MKIQGPGSILLIVAFALASAAPPATVEAATLAFPRGTRPLAK